MSENDQPKLDFARLRARATRRQDGNSPYGFVRINPADLLALVDAAEERNRLAALFDFGETVTAEAFDAIVKHGADTNKLGERVAALERRERELEAELDESESEGGALSTDLEKVQTELDAAEKELKRLRDWIHAKQFGSPGPCICGLLSHLDSREAHRICEAAREKFEMHFAGHDDEPVADPNEPPACGICGSHACVHPACEDLSRDLEREEHEESDTSDDYEPNASGGNVDG